MHLYFPRLPISSISKIEHPETGDVELVLLAADFTVIGKLVIYDFNPGSLESTGILKMIRGEHAGVVRGSVVSTWVDLKNFHDDFLFIEDCHGFKSKADLVRIDPSIKT